MINKWTNTTIEQINNSIKELSQRWNISERDNDIIFDKIIGLQIKKLRIMRSTKYRYMSQTKLAKAIKVTFQQVQKYEKGNNDIKLKKILRIAEYLGVDIKYIIKPFVKHNLLFTQKKEKPDVYKFTRPQFMERQENTSHE